MEPNNWEDKMREYIDKFFVQKAKGMKNLDREVVIDYVRNLLTQQEARLKQAFGGCTKCYGKGYATHMQQLTGYDDFGGEGFQEKPKVHITYCSCDRGKQLAKLVTLKD